jgi:PAS domain S-box-containing protein
MDSVSDAVIVLTPDSRVMMVNKTLCDILDIRAEEWLGKTPKQLISEGYIDRSTVYETVRTGKEVSDIVHTRNGLEVMSRCRPIFDRGGSLKYLVVTSTSLTELNQLRASLEKERRQTSKYLRELEHLRKTLLINEDFIFESPNMRSVLEIVKKISPMECTVLITGESGVGKEVLAKTIHMNSPKKGAPFIPVSIPAIPESLLESELFGFEEGAFTGSAKGGKMGLFEIAQGGTLFLDEIGDVPLNIQVKLLRAIESGEITRVGATRSIRLKVRIIAATNKSIEGEIKKGNFREDLFYRLNVVPIEIRPLRERVEDIWPLCSYFLEKINHKYGMKKEFTFEALEKLKNHKWPGNVRELRNVVERLAILSNSAQISADDVESILCSEPAPFHAQDLLTELDSMERSSILNALKQAKGNRSRAAVLLGISRSKLYRKINQFNGKNFR